jgi:hypothetical protein
MPGADGGRAAPPGHTMATARETVGTTSRAAETVRDWGKDVAERALRKLGAQPRANRRANREKELFALRAQHVRGLFTRVDALVSAVNREASSALIKVEKALNPKNLGGIEVPDGARLVLTFLDRRAEVVVNPLANVAGRPVPLGGLATASVIQYDSSDPSGADWFDLTLREDGAWLRKAGADQQQEAFGERDVRRLVEWLVS